MNIKNDINSNNEADPRSRRAFMAGLVGGGLGICAGCVLTRWGAMAARVAPSESPSAPAPDFSALQPTMHGDESRFVADARHWDAEGDVVTCRLCPRECKVPPDERGYCGVRENRAGQYKTLVHSRPCITNVDPIEKKPFFHFLPGSAAFSLATAGCNIECKFCQNWQTSQVRPEQIEGAFAPPERIVDLAIQSRAPSIAFTYTEPVIFYEYMSDIADAARRRSVRAVMVSNGYIQEKPLLELLPRLSAVKIDLKGFTEEFYKETCNGKLQPVLDTLERIKKSGLWFELVVLIVPTLNDGEEECRAMVDWIASHLGPDVPVHFTRFHPMYKLTNLPSTPVATLTRNYEMARAAGLHFPYVGNVPGHPGESTYCPACNKKIIERYGLATRSRVGEGGVCPDCGVKIPGVWA